MSILDGPLEFERFERCVIFAPVHHSNDSMGKDLKNIISNAEFLCTILHVGGFTEEADTLR